MNESQPKSPRVQARTALESIRRGEDLVGRVEGGQVKAEIYAIAAYFIEKAAQEAQLWLQENPGKGLQHHVHSIEGVVIESSIEMVDDIPSFLSSTNRAEVLFRISKLIEGLLHYHVTRVMNADFPAPLVNPQDEHIQERMRSLLEHADFRDGLDHQAQSFVLSATRAPAVFIPVSYHAGLTAFSEAFGRLPESTAELDLFTKRISPVLLRLAQFNVDDIGSFIEKHFGGSSARTDLPLAAFDKQLTIERRDNDDYRFSFPEVDSHKESEDVSEPTVGCPALYARSGSQNVIRMMITYTTDLLRQSGLYANNNR